MRQVSAFVDECRERSRLQGNKERLGHRLHFSGAFVAVVTHPRSRGASGGLACSSLLTHLQLRVLSSAGETYHWTARMAAICGARGVAQLRRFALKIAPKWCSTRGCIKEQCAHERARWQP